MTYNIKSAVIICARIMLFLATAYYSGNPLSALAHDPRSPDSTTCHGWRLDTNSENDSIMQVSNGITVFNRVTPYGKLLNNLVCIPNAMQHALQNNY